MANLVEREMDRRIAKGRRDIKEAEFTRGLKISLTNKAWLWIYLDLM